MGDVKPQYPTLPKHETPRFYGARAPISLAQPASLPRLRLNRPSPAARSNALTAPTCAACSRTKWRRRESVSRRRETS